MARTIPPIRGAPSGGFFDPSSLVPPNFELIGWYTGWRNDWSNIVAGQFTAGIYSSLLFYEQSTGHVEFYETHGQRNITLFHQEDGWRTSWSLIVPGYFRQCAFLPKNRQPSNTGLLLYDREAGFGAIYDSNGHGVIEKLAEYTDWRNSWTHIIAGNFTGSPFSGLLFYEGETGYAELYETDGAGGIGNGPIKTYNFGKNWTHLVAGDFWTDGDTGKPVYTDLFFYDSSSHFGVVYGNDVDGNFFQVSPPPSATQVSRAEIILPSPTSTLSPRPIFPAATLLLSGSFGFTEYTNLLFYDGDSGTGTFVGINYDNSTPPVLSWSVCEKHTDWGKGLNSVVAGNFWMDDPEDVYFPDGGFADLLFYDQPSGTGSFYMHEPPDTTPSMPLAGYASARSVFPGDTINFYVSSQVGAYKLQVLRKGLQDRHMADLDVTPADPLPIPRQAYRDGAGWPPVASLAIPNDWPSGLYVARAYVSPLNTPLFGDSNPAQRLARLQDPTLDIPFVLRPANPGQSARILVVIPDTVYEAYNIWGGRSLYGFGSQENYIWAYPQNATRVPYSFRVSFLRPQWGPPDGAVKWQHYEVPFIQWIERQSVRVEYCVASDLDSQNALSFLSCYKLLVTVGHSEYWSKGMKDNVQAFISKGGNAAFFGGNICYWQIRFENDPQHGPRMVCYKQEPFDPNSNGSPQQRLTRTVLWSAMNSQADGFDTDFKLTGVSYEWTTYPTPPAFKVVQPGHWIFANTGLALNDLFGFAIAGPETDHQTVTRNPGDTPANFVLVANEMIGDSEIASMGVMEGAGTVFTAAATEWALGLSQDGSWGAIDQITRNVLIRLG